MGYSNPWPFMSRESCADTLTTTLWELYGVQCPEAGSFSSLKLYFEKVCEACANMGGRQSVSKASGVTDENYFAYTPKELLDDLLANTHKLDFLVMDTLFHIRKEELEGENYASFNSFYDNNAKVLLSLKAESEGNKQKKNSSKKDTRDGSYTASNLSSRFKTHMTTAEDDGSGINRWESLFGISRNSPKEKGGPTNYCIPRFMSQLLILTADTIAKNPYCPSVALPVEINMVKLFFTAHYPAWASALIQAEKGDARGRSVQDDEIDCLLSMYAMCRLYDPESMVYWGHNQHRTTLKIETIMDALLPIYVVPNPLGKQAYLELVFNMLEGEIAFTNFDWWEDGEDVIAKVVPTFTTSETAAHNLKRAGEYLRYLGMIYYPVLSACFYAGFRKTYPKEKMQEAKNILMAYVQDENLMGKYKDHIEELCSRMKRFCNHEWEIAATYCNKLKKEFWMSDSPIEKWQDRTSLHYINHENVYQKTILNAVIREKVQGETEPILETKAKSLGQLIDLVRLLSSPKASDTVTELINLLNEGKK